MNTQYQEVIDSFESTFRDKYALSETLVKQWFLDSVGEFSLEIEPLVFDKELNEFNTVLDQWKITSLGLMMKIKYCIREVNRVNKLANIISKEVSLNSTGETKKYTKEELDSEIQHLTRLLDNQKPSAYV